MKHRSIFIASTGQHVGKTTTCLGLISGFKKRFEKVGFMKPVGQEHVEVTTGVHADKDVVLFNDTFDLGGDYENMSPVLFPRGFTREHLDGKHNTALLENKVVSAFHTIQSERDWTIVEGTGHVGVGSIVGLNNARVAKALKTPMILVASGGLGSSFDSLSLNKAMCDHYGVPILGIILNRVYDDKREMVLNYMQKALSSWNVPILGCIPYDEILSNPSMEDYETLFKTELITGREFHFRRFKHKRLVAASKERFEKIIEEGDLLITPATRDDIILAALKRHWQLKIRDPDADMGLGFILTGEVPPSADIVQKMADSNVPMIHVPYSSYETMQKITSFTAKFRKEDKEKVSEGIHVVESHVNFDLIIDQLQKQSMN